MPGKKIFLTGISGFIGSHLAEMLLSEGFQLMSLKRNITNLWRCDSFQHLIEWTSEDSLEKSLLEFSPDIIIHLGWTGITQTDRESWETQFSNFEVLFKLLAIAGKSATRKFIAIGSQAEYGTIQGRVSESLTPIPTNAYAVAKLAAQKAIQIACEKNLIEWYWLRVFSVFGPKEDKKWFVPMIITNLLNDTPCSLTKCEQQYDYLYIKDLVKMILLVISNPDNLSGIYNISSNCSQSLRSIIIQIDEIIQSRSSISFGALPYRENQSMHIEGDCTLFNQAFGHSTKLDMRDALRDTIDFYR